MVKIMNLDQAVLLLKKIKLYKGRKIKITYYEQNYEYQLVDNEWKIIFTGYKKVFKDVTLVDVNNFISVLVDDDNTQKNFPFFGVDCIIESLKVINADNTLSTIYENTFLSKHDLNVGNNKLGQETRKKMFKLENINEEIEEYIKNERLSRSGNNPLLNDLFNRTSIFDYGVRDRLFPFTNEMLNLYMPFYSFKGKKILANLGGGDFALNAYLLGASSVDTFDINEYSYYYYELKKALIKYYSYSDFLKIIENPQKIYDDFDSYKYLLKEDDSEFISNMFKKYNSCLIGFAKKLFLPSKFVADEREFSSKDLINLRMSAQFRNFYLHNEKNYNLIRNYLLNSIDYQSEFFLGNVMSLQFKERYDIIYLSNIGDVVDTQEYAEFINFLQENNLTDDGVIIVVDKAKKFDFLLNNENVLKDDYNVDLITQYNLRNAGVSSIPESEKNVSLFSIYKNNKIKHISKD